MCNLAMGSSVDNSERELDGWPRNYAGHSRREMIRLVALEREETVSAGYCEESAANRLGLRHRK